MAVELEELLARVRLDTSGLDQGLASAQSGLGRAASGMTSAGKSLTAGVTLPLAGIAVAGVAMAADFDKTMRQVGIATGAPTASLQKLALQMGQDTAFSAKDAGDAMLELAKGGMTAAQIKGGALEATMTAAAAGGISLEEASTLVSNSMATFGLKTSQASDIAVALAGAANASSASMGSLQQGLSAVGGVAASAGLSLQETVGTLSAFDAQGLKGSDAGTSLKAMLNSLVPTTDKATNAMKDLGLNFVKPNGEFDSMTTVAGKLHKALGPLPAAQRSLALETIFGSDGMRAANALTNEGAAGLQKYLKATHDTATTQKLANAQMEGLSGAIEQAKGSLETAAILIGTALAPAIMKVAGFVGSAANAFSSLSPKMQTVIVVVAAIAAAVGPLLLILGAMAAGLPVLAGAFGLLLSPVVLVVAAVAGIVAAFVILYQHSQAVRDAVSNIGASFGQLLAAVGPVVAQLVGIVRANMPQIQAITQQAWSTVRTIITTVIQTIATVVRVGVAVFLAVWRTIGPAVLGVVRAVFPAVLTVIKGALNIIQGIVRAFSAILKGDWSGLWKAVQQILKGAWQIISGVVRAALAVIKGIFQAGWAIIKSVATAAFKGIVGAIKDGVGNAIDLVKSLPGKAKSALGNLGSVLLNAGRDLIQGLINGIGDKIGEAVQKVKDGLGKIKDLLPGSPIKDGPLVGWNNTGPTGPGGQLMGRLADGIRSGTGMATGAMRDAARQMAGVGMTGPSLSAGTITGRRPGGTGADAAVPGGGPTVSVKVDAPQAVSPDTLGGLVAGKVVGVLVGRGTVLEGS